MTRIAARTVNDSDRNLARTDRNLDRGSGRLGAHSDSDSAEDSDSDSDSNPGRAGRSCTIELY